MMICDIFPELKYFTLCLVVIAIPFLVIISVQDESLAYIYGVLKNIWKKKNQMQQVLLKVVKMVNE